jgi:proline dehydrogenase
MSKAIKEAENLFYKFDTNGDGVVSREEFEQGYSLFFKDADTKLPALLDSLDPNGTGEVDYITWCMQLTPKDVPKITESCIDVGPFALATPTKEELKLMETMFDRARSVAEEAARWGTRVLVDAEQARYQPAINNLVLELQQEYNATEKTDSPIIFNTYQCYLKDTAKRLRLDLERSDRYSYHFGAKLVRGAYMESERKLAEKKGYPDPIHDTIEDTHRTYNESVEFLLRHAVESDKKLEIMCATHNQHSIEMTIKLMDELGIDKSSSTICFAQLLGMSDNLTFNLGDYGYNAYKYVPYGEVKKVIPYLVRRVRENSAVLESGKVELEMLRKELRSRFKTLIGMNQ